MELSRDSFNAEIMYAKFDLFRNLVENKLGKMMASR
jgi:hypothetical protein